MDFHGISSCFISLRSVFIQMTLNFKLNQTKQKTFFLKQIKLCNMDKSEYFVIVFPSVKLFHIKNVVVNVVIKINVSRIYSTQI